MTTYKNILNTTGAENDGAYNFWLMAILTVPIFLCILLAKKYFLKPENPVEIFFRKCAWGIEDSSKEETPLKNTLITLLTKVPVTTTDAHGRNALYYACLSEKELRVYFTQNNITPSAIDFFMQNFKAERQLATVKFLLEQGFKPDHTDQQEISVRQILVERSKAIPNTDITAEDVVIAKNQLQLLDNFKIPQLREDEVPPHSHQL